MRMKKRSRLGFTLVELIVVIAILAILAGVAIPIYSGYIKKANRAADLVLLDAVNSAFAAACLENNVKAKSLSGVALQVTKENNKNYITGVRASDASVAAAAIRAENGHGGIAMLSSHAFAELATGADLNASFQKYFKGNETCELKYYTQSSDFVFRGGGFVAKDFATSAVTFLDSEHNDTAQTTTFHFTNEAGDPIDYTVSDTAIAAYEASSFSNQQPSNLTSEVSDMVNAMTSMMGSGGTQLAGILNDAGLDFSTLGMDVYQLNEDGTIKTDESGNKLLDSEKLKNYGGDSYANAVVMMVAQNSNASSFGTLQNAIKTGKLESLFKDENDKPVNQAQMLSNAAMLYGVAVAYANSDAAKTQTIDGKSASEYLGYINQQIKTAAAGNGPTENRITDVMSAIELIGNFAYASGGGFTQEFAAYASAPEGGVSQLQIDAGGYLAAMETVSNNSAALVSSGAINYGFDDPTIAAILNTILGGNT